MTTPTDDINDNVLQFEQPQAVMTMTPQPINITFTSDEGEKVGEFLYDRETRKWSFEGDVEESARKFLNFLNSISGEN